METLERPVSASTNTEHEINFLLVRDRSGDWPRWKQAAVGSVVFHLFAITALFLIKGSAYEPLPENRDVPRIVHLYIPKELTQKAPNKGAVSKLLLSAPSAPSPKLNEPAPRVAKAPPPPPAPVPASVQPKPPVVPIPVAPPAPNPGELARNQPPAASLPPVTLPKPDAPKMIVEDSMQLHPAPKSGGLTSLNPLNDSLHPMTNVGQGTVGSRGGDSELSVGGGMRLPPSAARLSNFQLKSDPMGVDFGPYLQQVLAAVKLNWSAVFPTAARLGQRGVVSLDFAIAKDGSVTKIVFESQSGSRPLDNASVAAISASNPLPSLPRDFKGDRIVVQMSFMYNIPK